MPSYRTVKIRKRIVFVPDRGLKDLLDYRKKVLRKYIKKNNSISAFGIGGGLKMLLTRHINSKHRFFVVVDFVHAFHQITRDMMGKVFPEILDDYWDVCFAPLSGEIIIPTGFPSSSALFEIFFQRVVDAKLASWAKSYNGMATRSGDNILITWKKDTPEAWRDLLIVFEGFQVRFTPQKPKKWQEPIRFCGVLLPRRGRPIISNGRKKLLLERAKNNQKSYLGVLRFLAQWH